MDPQHAMWDDILAYLAGVQAAGRNVLPNSAPPVPPAAQGQNPVALSGNTASTSALSAMQSPSGLPPPAASMALYGHAQAAAPQAIPQSNAIHASIPTFSVASIAAQQPARRGQQRTAYGPPPPGTARPQPRQAYHKLLPAPAPAPASAIQQPLVRPPIVPSHGLPPAARTTSVVPPVQNHGQPAPAHLAHPQWAQVQHFGRQQQHARPLQGQPVYALPGYQGPALPRAQPVYAPPPGPPPGWQGHPLPPRALSAQLPHLPLRDLAASPSNAAIFTPSPALSTPATTPGFALTPSPTVGRTVSLPAQNQFAPHGGVTGQQASGPAARAADGDGAALDKPAARALKRRLSDEDADMYEPGRSKRAATRSVAQARSTNDATGRQVQFNNNNLPTQSAPASPQRDAAPILAAPEPAETSDDDAAADNDDVDSLFGDGAPTEAQADAEPTAIDSENVNGTTEAANAIDIAALAADLETAVDEGDADASPVEELTPVPSDEQDDAALVGVLEAALREGEDNAGPAEEPALQLGDEQDLAALAAALEAALSSAQTDANSSGKTTPPALSSPKNQLWLPGMDKTTPTLALPGTDSIAASEHLPDPSPAQVPRLCLPGTDPVPEGKVARTGPNAHLPPASEPAACPDARKRKKPAGTAQAPLAASGPSNPSGSQAQPPKADVRDAVARENEAKRVRNAGHVVRVQNPELFNRYSWLSGTMEQGPSTAPTQTALLPAAASAPALALPVFTRPPPDLGPDNLRPEHAEKNKPSPMSGYAPKDKRYWCKMCWEARAARMFWFDSRGLRGHVRVRHPELLDSDVWRHEGM
ncbi:hypothetical protein AURDEDRAFT_171724 [Auricularia subglabra TFB-10046 SS5]|nr:hypothetical protein AURDEDRAFT_171724 [Auricularia subglabra TFB-10046 SS5]